MCWSVLQYVTVHHTALHFLFHLPVLAPAPKTHYLTPSFQESYNCHCNPPQCEAAQPQPPLPLFQRAVFRELHHKRNHNMLRCSCDAGCCSKLQSNCQWNLRQIETPMLQCVAVRLSVSVLQWNCCCSVLPWNCCCSVLPWNYLWNLRQSETSQLLHTMRCRSPPPHFRKAQYFRVSAGALMKYCRMLQNVAECCGMLHVL